MYTATFNHSKFLPTDETKPMFPVCVERKRAAWQRVLGPEGSSKPLACISVPKNIEVTQNRLLIAYLFTVFKAGSRALPVLSSHRIWLVCGAED